MAVAALFPTRDEKIKTFEGACLRSVVMALDRVGGTAAGIFKMGEKSAGRSACATGGDTMQERHAKSSRGGITSDHYRSVIRTAGHLCRAFKLEPGSYSPVRGGVYVAMKLRATKMVVAASCKLPLIR